MALIKVPPVTPQATPLMDERAGDTLLPKLLANTYWLYLYATQVAMQALAAAVDVIERTYVRGSTALLNVGAIPKVGATGTLIKSAITDDGVDDVFVVGRNLWIDNGKVLKTYNAALVGRNLITHWTDDIVYLDNGDGGIHLRPTTNGVSIGKAPTANSVDAVGDVNTDGVYKVAATQVVGPRGAALAATAPAGTAAGAAYVQATAATWVTLMNQNKLRLDALEARLQAHGLIT